MTDDVMQCVHFLGIMDEPDSAVCMSGCRMQVVRMHRMKHSVEARWELVCIHLTVLRKVHTQVGLNISLQTIVMAQ